MSGAMWCVASPESRASSTSGHLVPMDHALAKAAWTVARLMQAMCFAMVAEEDMQCMLYRRADNWASQQRKVVRKTMHRMQSDGCAMSALCHTRAGNNKAYVSQEVLRL